ncbi:MAG TPA: hypothetical protein DEP84_28335 [Chloroflexi bacterium]|nr:hypothetical protein [Chloroflexota bacterium]
MTEDRIGFDRTIRLRWLDQAALLARELRDNEALREALFECLTHDVRGEESRRKTVTVLARIWWRVPEEHILFREEAFAMVAQETPGARLALHWGMALLAYPLFRDVTAIIGRLLRLQGAFTLAQVSRRISADWGNRTTLKYAVPRILRSLSDWEIVEPTKEVGGYEPCPPILSPRVGPALWLLEASLRARETDVPVSDLLRSPELFPFALPVSPGDLLRSGRFQVDQQGQDLLMVQKVSTANHGWR